MKRAEIPDPVRSVSAVVSGFYRGPGITAEREWRTLALAKH